MIPGTVIESSRLEFSTGSLIDLDEILIQLNDFGFHRTDFVYEPGQFSIRGGILDVFSYASDLPYRIELNDIVVESIRKFETESQLSKQNISHFSIVPTIYSEFQSEVRKNIFEIIPENTLIWVKDIHTCLETFEKCFLAANRQADKMKHYDEDRFISMVQNREFIDSSVLVESLEQFKLVFYNCKPDSAVKAAI